MTAPTQSRREFLSVTATAFSALIASGCVARGPNAATASTPFSDYGPLLPDPNGLLDLPEGFSYTIYPVNDTPSREVWCLDVLHEFINGDFRIIDSSHYPINYLT